MKYNQVEALTSAFFIQGGVKNWLDLLEDSTKVIYTKYSKHSPYTVAHTIECVCTKISLFKLIPCPYIELYMCLPI